MKLIKKPGFKFTLGGVLLVLFVAASVMAPSSANAIAGRGNYMGYFDNQSGLSSGWHDIFTGQGVPDSADKGTFINDIMGKLGGNAQQRTGAAFIINLQLGFNGPGVGRNPSAADIQEWKDRVNNPAISISLEDYSFTYNSAWADNINDAIFYVQPDTRHSLVFYHNGVKVSVIKQDCGNPLDGLFGLPGLPHYSPNWDLSSAAWADQGSVFPGQTINFHFRIHNNGPGSANFQYVDRFQPYSNGGNANPVWSWPTPNRFESGFPAGWDTNAYSAANITIPVNYTGNRYCAWTEYAGWSSWDGSPRGSNHVCVTVNTPTPSCNGYTLVPNAGLDPTTQFTITPSVRFQNQPMTNWVYSNGGRLFVTVTGPGYNKDYTLDWGPPAADDLTVAQLFPATGNTGTYTITYGIRGAPTGNITCGGTAGTSFLVGLYPYFRVESGDIAAGAGFGVACTLDNTAKIRGWNKGTGSYFGAGAQLGALALNSLDSNFFPTSTNVDGSLSGVASANRTGLTFANNTAPVGSYVGLPCMPDYAATAAATEGAIIGSSPNLNALPAGTKATYVINGDVTIPGGNLKNDVHVTFVVLSGDVTITNDIKYDPYATIAHAPQFQLLVKGGSIFIKQNVSELHGVYDAQPIGAAGGVINTCYTGSGKAQYVPCSNNQLKFYGAVTAKTILLARTYGNLNTYGSTTNWPAETFIYTPELWAAYSNKTGNGTMKYDAITSLPPIL